MAIDVDGEFRLEERLHSGRNGEVWRAHQPRLRRDVALRLYPGGAREPRVEERMACETEALARLPLPCVPRLLGAGATTACAWLAMELITGTPMAEDSRWVDTGLRHRVQWLARVCEEVGAVHDRGVEHGRLNARRILLDVSGRVHLLGFAEARSHGHAHADVADLARLLPSVTSHGSSARDLAAVLGQAREGRWSHAGDLARELRRWLNHEPVDARPPSAVRRAALAARRDRRALVAVAGLSGALLAALVMARMGAAREREQTEVTTRWIEDARGLSLVRELQALESQSRDLWPAEPFRTGAMSGWLVRVDGAVAGTRAAIAARQAHAAGELPPGDGLVGRWMDSRYDQLEDAMRRLEVAAGDVSMRLDRARDAASNVEGRDAAAWAATRKRQSDSTSPYRGRAIAPQAGLVPLGPDPESGLELFAAAATGALPRREAATGRVRAVAGDAIVLVLVPAGTYAVGMQASDPDAPMYDPKPPAVPCRAPTQIELPAYFEGKFELTQDQYRRLGGADSFFYVGWSWGPGHAVSEVNPAEQIDIGEARECLRRVGLRLPTPEEWEVAARAGCTTRWSFGPDPLDLAGAANVRTDLAEREAPGFASRAADSFPLHAPVGSFLANPWGLHDVHGNVTELVQGEPSPERPGLGPEGLGHMGGSWQSSPRMTACWIVRVVRPEERTSTLGLRVARDVR